VIGAKSSSNLTASRTSSIGASPSVTVTAANNLAFSLVDAQRFEEAKSLLRKVMPVARRVLGESSDLPFTMKKIHAEALYEDPAATLDDLREAVTTLEETVRIAQRVLGGSHPLTGKIELRLRDARAALTARDTPSTSG